MDALQRDHAVCGRLKMGIPLQGGSLLPEQAQPVYSGSGVGGAPGETVAGLQEAPDNLLPKPGLWLQPDVIPVSTWPCCGPTLAANDCLALPALPCHRPSHQARMSSGSSTSLCRGSFASGFPAGAAARMFCNEPGESIHSGKIREWTVLASRGLGERAVTACRAGVGAGHLWDSPFLRPCGTLASKLFICLSACPSGLEGLACSLQFPKGLPTAGQLEPSFALFRL